MFKKILTLSFLFLLSACAFKGREYISPLEQGLHQQEIEKTKTAVLLPLSGDSSALGDSFRNAILMAQLERATDEVTEVSFYDTKGTSEGALVALHQAQNEGADVILGPIFSTEVKTILDEDPSVPVITFTTDTSVLKKGVFSMGLLIEEQIKRIVKFSCERGERKIALLGPKGKTGELVYSAFEKEIQSCPAMELTHVSLYDEKNPDLTAAVTKIAPPLIDLKKKDLTDKEKELAKNPSAERIEFDALFVFEQGVRLQQLVSLLGYYDVTPNLVSFYGLATLRSQHNRDLMGAYFADLPQSGLVAYKQNYQDAFSVSPISVSALAFDAISLVSYLSKKGELSNKGLLAEEGFLGINGKFRFNETGGNDRLLEMFQIRGKNYIQSVSPAQYVF